MLAKGKARKRLLKQKQQQSKITQMIRGYQDRSRRMGKLVTSALQALKSQMPLEDLKMLKDLCMVDVPEQKDEKGEVTQAARKVLNKEALLKEAQNVIVLQREARIKNGDRKRSSGRSSKRRHHRDMLAMINNRSELAKNEQQG